jgi:hypothetical protein
LTGEVIAHGAYVANAVAHCSACRGTGESTNKHELTADPRDLRGAWTTKISAPIEVRVASWREDLVGN